MRNVRPLAQQAGRGVDTELQEKGSDQPARHGSGEAFYTKLRPEKLSKAIVEVHLRVRPFVGGHMGLPLQKNKDIFPA